MKKFYLFFLIIALPFLSKAESFTEDFNTWYDSYTSLTKNDTTLPNGWYAIYENTFSGGGQLVYDLTIGSESTAGLKHNATKSITLIHYAYGCAEGATLSWDVKKNFDTATNQYMEIYEMIDNGDGTFSYGEQLGSYDIVGMCNAAEYTTVSWTGLTKDCYVGFKFYAIQLDNYVNTCKSVEIPVYDIIGEVKCNDVIIVNAIVELIGNETFTTNTDEHGCFKFTGLTSGNYSLLIQADGYQSHSEDIKLNSDITNICIELKEIYYSFTAQVVDVAGEPLNAEVEVVAGEEAIEVLSEELGKYSFSVSALSSKDVEYNVTVKSEGYEPSIYTFKFEGEDVEHTFELKEIYYSFTAQVVDVAGEPLNAEVEVMTGEEAIEVLSEELGKYSFSVSALSSKDVEYNVTVKSEGYESSTYTFKFEGEDIEHTFELKEIYYSFTAQVVDVAGEPLNAEVEVMAGEEAIEVLSEELGKYSFNVSALASKDVEYNVTVKSEGYEPSTYTFKFEGEDVEHTFELKEIYYSFTAQVVDVAGEPLNAEVEVMAGEEAIEVLSEELGKYSFSVSALSSKDVEYNVTVKSEGYEPSTYTFKFEVEDIEHTFELKEIYYSFTAQVVDVAGEPLNAEVEVMAGEEAIEVLSEELGKYSFSVSALSSKDVEYNVTVKSEGYESSTYTFKFEGEDVEHTFELKEIYDSIFQSFSEDKIYTINGILYVNVDAVIYDISGRLIRVIKTSETVSVDGLSTGYYIVNGKKIYVK